jgi:hypothetical protein
MMVSLEECIDMCGLSEDEVEVIAEQEHVPVLVAAELAYTLLQSPKGLYRLHHIFRDRLAALAAQREHAREKKVAALYAGFRARYPMPRRV